MKKTILLILLLMVNTIIWAQTEKATDKVILNNFERYYNASQYDSIFNLFAPVMKQALPLEQTRDFLSTLKRQAGNIVKREFIRYNGTSGIYKSSFEKAILSLNVSTDENLKINGLFIKPYTEDNIPAMERNITKLILPFHGEWTVVWGGDTKEQNYHIQSKAQKNAIDFIIKDRTGKSYKSDGKTNEDYYAFGKELFAPCNGEIVLVVDGVKDNKPGELNPIYVPGNTVIIKTAANEYLFFAHFKQHSIKVKQGDNVKQGQVLGLCGNSGNSSEAHLHYHIQQVEDMNKATGVKCYFDKIRINGELKTDYSPLQNEKVKNDKEGI